MMNITELLSYDPLTGQFNWRGQKRGARRSTAGCTNAMGYRVIRINRRLEYAHRLAWFFQYGAMPYHEVDHINGDRSDNRICNLRKATRAQNIQNSAVYKNNTSGVKGVRYEKRRQHWYAEIVTEKKRTYLGSFSTKKEAVAAYRLASEKQHREFGCLDRRAA